jgi:nucleoid-associated protein YgaU
MGRLEKQIIVGAIALVAILLGVVVLTGVKPVDDTNQPQNRSDWGGHGLLMESPEGGSSNPPVATEPGAGAILSLDEPLGAGAPVKSEADRLVPTVKQTPAIPEPGSDAPKVEPSPGRALSLDAEDQLRRYEVKPGETLGEISMRELGSMNDLDLLLEVNEGMRKDQVRAGDVIWLPSRAAADARRKQVQGAGPKEVRAAEASASASQPTRNSVTHEVVSGDSLWRIAQQYFGREGANAGVKRIVQANSKLTDENTVLRLGWVLTIPQ